MERSNIHELRDEVANIQRKEDARRVIIDLLRFHNKLNLLLLYYTLNCDGFMKIIKKHRKKTGESLSFMQDDDHNVVFIANSLDELVAECEELLVHTANRI
ncbi:putative SPX domain-containing protein [Helianthus anomalus]